MGIDTTRKNFNDTAFLVNLRQYNLTVTGTNWTTVRAIGVAYLTLDGAWRMTFNISGTLTSAARTSVTLAVTGTVFKNLANNQQTIAATPNVDTSINRCFAETGTGNLVTDFASVTCTGLFASGDVELESKPTWAV